MRKKNILIAGPCSVESKEQFFETAIELIQQCNPDYVRGGVWKPRTRPGSFEGHGQPALEWMTEFKSLHNIKLAVEVATKDQARMALDYGVDLFWIGARTTGNPFSIQELADFLSGNETPVYIKNPMNADISLWIGALERFEKAGIKNIGMIHRGFTITGNSLYRNPPMWHLAIEMKNRFKDYPLICDPSHITGKREMILDVSQNALNLNYDGLMIESHCDPDNSWSDASQQLTPVALKNILNQLDFEIYDGIEGVVNIHNYTSKSLIDLIDNELLFLLEKRKEILNQITQDGLDINFERINSRLSNLLTNIK
jgi:chorismate mutase